jgi:hypothetical protein
MLLGGGFSEVPPFSPLAAPSPQAAATPSTPSQAAAHLLLQTLLSALASSIWLWPVVAAVVTAAAGLAV